MSSVWAYLVEGMKYQANSSTSEFYDVDPLYFKLSQKNALILLW
ncbi:hypothetical protein [Gracilibacillus thailandensis]|nr:hypothetical protein [Gracilibacillus thailandensis]